MSCNIVSDIGEVIGDQCEVKQSWDSEMLSTFTIKKSQFPETNMVR